MICPKCKKQIPKDTINCPHCNTKIGTICKHCHSYNLIYNKACVECGAELIKFCPECKAANFPNVARCRKCGYSFRKSKITNNNQSQPNKPIRDIIVPPRQFVLPAITSAQESARLKAKKARKRSVNDEFATQLFLNESLEQSPINLRKITDTTISKTPNNKKVIKKIKKRKTTTSIQDEAIQSQLNSLQAQLSGLQEQLRSLPQQLSQAPATNETINTQPQNIVLPSISGTKDKVKSEDLTPTNNNLSIEPSLKKEEQSIKTQKNKLTTQKREEPVENILPRIKKVLKNNSTTKSSEKLGAESNKKLVRPKGILPLKVNIFPNRRNVNLKRGTLSKDAANLNAKNGRVDSNATNRKGMLVGGVDGEYSSNLFTQQSAKNVLVNTLLNTNISIISLSGESGIGKNIVLKTTIDELKENHFVWLVGRATPLSKLTPCGLFQDILLTFFNVPSFCVDTKKLKKESMGFFKSEFPSLKHDEIDDLINFLYPEKVSFYEDLFKNKNRTFSILRKIFDTISSRMQTVFVFDDFDNIDAMSYEFLKTLINAETGLINTKFILTYTEQRSAKSYLYDKTLGNEAYTDISLVPFNDSQTETFINQYNPLFIGTPQSIKDNIHSLTKGNPAHIEQILCLITDTNRNYLKFTLPNSFEETIKTRLEILKKENILVYELLVAAAILGVKFYPIILNQLFKIDNNSFVELFTSLLELNYISPVNESAYEFKSTKLWKTILALASRDSHFAAINEKLFLILSGFSLSSNSNLAIISNNLRQNLSSLNIWSDIVKISAAIGDDNLYVIAQKRSLELVEKLQGVNSSLIKNNIYERLGKVLTYSNPKQAMTYLPKVIDHIRKLGDDLKEFELIGYLAHCCYETNNHYEVINCIDKAISNIDIGYDLEIAILKAKKLNSMLIIGNYGEIVELIDSEIMPILEENLDTTKSFHNVTIETVFETWLQAYLILANALTLKGDNRAFNVICTIFEIIEKNFVKDELYICKTKLTLALANTLKGDITESENILDETLRQYKNNDVMDAKAITRWNIISVLNNIIHGNYDGLNNELFQIATFVNNNNDILNKNLLKVLLAKTLKEKGKFKQAISIYSEQVAYFTKEKNSLGVLLTWYLISELTLLTEGPKKTLDYALKALDIAQNKKIQNYYFITQLNKIIGEAYLADQNYDAAKIYIESAIGTARQFELLDILSELYLIYGKYLNVLAEINTDAQADYAKSAYKMYKKAFQLTETLKNQSQLVNIQTIISELREFCQKRKIILR